MVVYDSRCANKKIICVINTMDFSDRCTFICKGYGAVFVPPEHASHSEVARFMTTDCSHPGDPVELPPWVGARVFGLRRILSHAHNSPTRVEMYGDTSALATACVECVPGLSLPATCATFQCALEWLNVVRFLDVEHAVRLLFGYIRHALNECETVEDLVDMLYEGDSFKKLCLGEKAACYQKLLVDRDVLMGYVGGINPWGVHEEHELSTG